MQQMNNRSKTVYNSTLQIKLNKKENWELHHLNMYAKRTETNTSKFFTVNYNYMIFFFA